MLATNTRRTLDAGTFTIVSQGLGAIAQEMGAKLVRSAYSTSIREARDRSTSLLDRDGKIVASRCRTSQCRCPRFRERLPVARCSRGAHVS